MADFIKNIILVVAMIVLGTTTCMFHTQEKIDELRLDSNSKTSDVGR